MENLWVPIDEETWSKWEKFVEDNYNPEWFHNRLGVPEDIRKFQIIRGHVAQELIAKWLEDFLSYKVEVNLEVGKDMYDTDTGRGKPDVMINDKKVDIKISKLIRADYKKYDLILIAEFVDEPGIKGFDIKGYWKTKDLKIEEMDKMPGDYLLPRKRFSRMTTFEKSLK